MATCTMCGGDGHWSGAHGEIVECKPCRGTGEVERWLVSYSTRQHTLKRDGFLTMGLPYDVFDLIDEHPAAMVARSRLEIDALREAQPGEEVLTEFEVVALYSAVPVPDGALTDEQVEAFL